jgi:hypothetical protein
VDLDKQNGLIRAGLAHHAYRLLAQYESLDLSEEQRFDVTLHLCVLQMLLANSVELVIATNSERKKAQWLAPLEPLVDRLIDHPGAIEQDTFPDPGPDTLQVLTHLRNALSHPRMTHTLPPTTTGYTTNSDGRGVITSVTFTDSPDYNTKGRLREQQHRPRHKGEPYAGPARLFTIRIDVQGIFSLTRAVADRLREDAAGKISYEFAVDRPEVLAG